MTEYVWHRAWNVHNSGDIPAGVPVDVHQTQLVRVLAWHQDSATVIDLDPPFGGIPYSVPLDELRFGYPSEDA